MKNKENRNTGRQGLRCPVLIFYHTADSCWKVKEIVEFSYFQSCLFVIK